MVVKSKIGRKRYIVFEIESISNITKRDLVFTLNGMLYKSASKDQDAEDPNSVFYFSRISSQSQHKQINQMPETEADIHGIVHKSTNDSIREMVFLRLPWIILIKNNYGLIRCHHLDTVKTIQLLQSIHSAGKQGNLVKINTLGTTGTIKSARKKYLDKVIINPLNKVYTK
jgi:RNase P/RNase MRP subunit POP5